jgi:hypothetical protein
MGFLIDTNVLSELQKGERADAGVRDWYGKAGHDELYLSALVVGELRQGIERLRRRDPIQADRLERRLAAVHGQMRERVLSITVAVADRWGRINAAAGPLPVIDGLLAATALAHDLVLVTRNVRDVERSGVRLINPFSETAGE